MADISIPGVTASKYKTEELIEGLMKLERVPRERADEDLQTYKKQQEAWRQLSRHVSTLRDSVRTLYSYRNSGKRHLHIHSGRQKTGIRMEGRKLF